VLENVLLAAERRHASAKSALALAQASLEQVGIAPSLHHLTAANLAPGTLKMVDLARLIASNPIVALLDEPSSGIGEAELPWLFAGLDSLRATGAAILVVEHNLEFTREFADSLMVLDFGQVIAQGDSEEVLRSKVVQRAYLGVGDE